LKQADDLGYDHSEVNNGTVIGASAQLILSDKYNRARLTSAATIFVLVAAAGNARTAARTKSHQQTPLAIDLEAVRQIVAESHRNHEERLPEQGSLSYDEALSFAERSEIQRQPQYVVRVRETFLAHRYIERNEWMTSDC
jgi:hypothetical protein